MEDRSLPACTILPAIITFLPTTVGIMAEYLVITCILHALLRAGGVATRAGGPGVWSDRPDHAWKRWPDIRLAGNMHIAACQCGGGPGPRAVPPERSAAILTEQAPNAKAG